MLYLLHATHPAAWLNIHIPYSVGMGTYAHGLRINVMSQMAAILIFSLNGYPVKINIHTKFSLHTLMHLFLSAYKTFCEDS